MGCAASAIGMSPHLRTLQCTTLTTCFRLEPFALRVARCLPRRGCYHRFLGVYGLGLCAVLLSWPLPILVAAAPCAAPQRHRRPSFPLPFVTGFRCCVNTLSPLPGGAAFCQVRLHLSHRKALRWIAVQYGRHGVSLRARRNLRCVVALVHVY